MPLWIICEGNFMEVQQDFKDLLALFNAHKVDFMIVGGYALAAHGAPRFTGDMDIFVKRDAVNAKHIMAALDEYGFGSTGLSAADFESPDKVIQLGFPPVRVDIMTSISGVTWEEAYPARTEGQYGEISVYFIGRNELVINKRKMGRKKDLADLEALGED